MIVAAILTAWAVLGLIALVGLGKVMTSWNRVADAMHKADPRLRDAIGWPHRNLALLHIVWPKEGFRMWRVQVRTSLYGLPDTKRIPLEARRYSRLTWLFTAPFFLPGLIMGLMATEILIFLIFVPLALVAIAGRWPDDEAIERHVIA